MSSLGEISVKKRGTARIASWKYGVGAWMLAVILAAFLYAGDAESFVPGAARIIFFHLPMAMMATIAFWTSMVYAIHYLRRRQRITDLKSVCAAELGLLYCIVTTITGSIFAKIMWNSFWNWDPRETSILVLLLIYGAYFGLRSAVEDEERRATLAAVYNVFAGVVMPFLVFVVPRIPALQSMHPPNIWKSGGMSPDYRVVLYSSLLGFLGLFVWMFQLRLRVGLIELRRESEESAVGRPATVTATRRVPGS
jgi:heme exporter protein C